MTTRQIEQSIQPRIVRDAFGFPRIEQPNEPRFAPLAVMCMLGGVIAAWTLAWVVTR